MSEEQKERGITELTRRELLSGAGKLALGASLLAPAGVSLFTPTGARAEATGKMSAKGGKVDIEEYCNTAGLKSSAEYPWPYREIDPEIAAAIAYRNWYKGFCAYGALSGVMIPLQVEVGEPYTSLPLEAFAYGHGGMVGWGTLCGTLFGSTIAISMATGKEGEAMVNDLLNWYGATELPTYQPDNPRATFKNINASNSPPCHVSVGKWMAKEGVGFNSPERRDRCARLAADVAKKSVEMLNAYHAGTYAPGYTTHQVKEHSITAQNNCTDCHGS